MRLLLAVLLAAAPFLAPSPARADAPVEPVAITARPITDFRIGSGERAFGPLTFNGGFELSGSSEHLGALSGLRFLDGAGGFIGVADTGFWFFGRLTRDGAGRPTGMRDFHMQAMVNAAGGTDDFKWDVDAESIAVRGGSAVVGFERNHRIARYPLDPASLASAGMGAPVASLPFAIPAYELRQNRGFECLAYDSGGTLVTVAERSLDRAGNLFAAIVEGEGRGVFTVKRDDPFDVSDCAFLPGGDLLLLERSFSMASGVGMRLRRLPAASLRRGALADGPVLLQADMRFQIDNMEALDVWRAADGRLMVSMLSDDNHSILQRTIYLEFVLDEARDGS